MKTVHATRAVCRSLNAGKTTNAKSNVIAAAARFARKVVAPAQQFAFAA
jgi:hypothetical protein